MPVGVRREGVVLSPDEGWERGHDHGGVEDPRITWIPSLGLHVMTYVAFGPLGPRPALAVSADLRHWRRLGPIHFAYTHGLDTDLNLFHNKDMVFFPEPVPGPDGEPAYAMLHRPMWNMGKAVGGVYLPAGITDPRPAIWISYVPAAGRADRHPHADPRGRAPPGRLLRVRLGGDEDRRRAAPDPGARGVAAHPPRRLRRGGRGLGPAAGPGVLGRGDAARPRRPGRVLARTPFPLLEPVEAEERQGLVPNVVFPTAIAEIDGQRFVFYGMADTSIGVARLEVAS